MTVIAKSNRQIAEEKVRATIAALEEEAMVRGLGVAPHSWGAQGRSVGGVDVRVKEGMTNDRWHSKPTGKVSVSVTGFRQPGAWHQAYPTKTFPEGKQGVNIGKVLDRVQEVMAFQAQEDAKTQKCERAEEEVAAQQALNARKAAALDKLEDRKESIMHSLSARSIGDEPHSHWHLCDAALEDDKHSLLALAEALPDPDAALARARAAHEAGIKAEMATGYDPAAEGCAPELSQDEWDAILPEEE